MALSFKNARCWISGDIVKESWSDFEKYVFDKLEKISENQLDSEHRFTIIETKAAALGAVMGLFAGALMAFFRRM